MFRFATLAVSFATVLALADEPKKKEEPKKEQLDPEIEAIAAKLKDKNPKTRIKALEDAAAKADKAFALSEKICDATFDGNAQVAVAAMSSLEKVRPDLYKPMLGIYSAKTDGQLAEALKALVALKDDAVPAANFLAARMHGGFAESGHGTKCALPQFEKGIIRRDNGAYNDLRAAKAAHGKACRCLNALETLKPDSEAARKARWELSKTTNMDYPSRFESLESLVKGCKGDEKEAKKLVPVIVAGFVQYQGELPENASDPMTRASLNRANAANVIRYMNILAEMGKHSKSQLPALKKLKLATDEGVRNAASKAVEVIEAAGE